MIDPMHLDRSKKPPATRIKPYFASAGVNSDRIRIHIGIVAVLISIIVHFNVAPVVAQQIRHNSFGNHLSQQKPTVLILHSYHFGFTWTDNISRGLQFAFSNYKDQIELRYEFIDARHIYTREYFESLYQLLNLKYSQIKINVVICSDDQSLHFMQQYGQKLFPGVPIVFCSVSGYKPDMLNSKNITGLIESIDIKGTLDVALKLQPATKTVAVITDTTRTGQALKTKAQTAFKTFEDRVDFQYLEDFTVEELQQKVTELERNAIIFLFIFNRDKAGRVFSHEQNLKNIAEYARVPIYSVWKFYLGHGIVGGMLTSGEAEGQMVGNIALRILQGEDVSTIPMESSPTRYMFDHKQLDRHGISEQNLPSGSIVLNRPFSFYQAYKLLILIVSSAFILLLICIGFLFVNITIRKKAEDRIKQIKLQQEALLNNIPDLAWLKDKLSRFIAVNEPFAKACGKTTDAIIGKTDADIWPAELADKYRSDDMEVVQSGVHKRIEEPLADNTGVIRQIETIKTPIYDTNNEIIGTTGIARDITERKKTENALRKSEEKFSKLFLTSPIWMLLATVEEGRYIEVNDSFIKITGYSREDVIGKTSTEFGLWLNPEERTEIVELLKKNGKFEAYPSKFRMKNGDIRDFLWSAVLIEFNNEQCALSALVDITDRKQVENERRRLQEHLMQAQKLEALGTLAGGIAHDFNNLLMGIQGRASLIQADEQKSPSLEENIKGIEKHVKSASKLTNQLLGFAREGKYEVMSTNLNELVQQTAQMFGRTRKEIDIRLNLHHHLQLVEIDRGQFEQVLINIFINAWQAMPGGGKLYLETENMNIDREYAEHHEVEQGNYVKLSITDTGVGMDEITRQRIFEPFYTTKEMGRGVGLGLASVYGIIKNHHGIINVYSEKGLGTTFNIYLPSSARLLRTGKKPVGEKSASGSETVLVVDDEEFVVDIGRKLLEKLGYNALVARSGEEALDIYLENAHQIDLVILDMIMPGMSGSKTFDRLLEINPDIKVLLSSGYSINGQAAGILEKGCSGFIQKPFNMQQLSEKVREILDT